MSHSNGDSHVTTLLIELDWDCIIVYIIILFMDLDLRVYFKFIYLMMIEYISNST